MSDLARRLAMHPEISAWSSFAPDLTDPSTAGVLIARLDRECKDRGWSWSLSRGVHAGIRLEIHGGTGDEGLAVTVAEHPGIACALLLLEIWA